MRLKDKVAIITGAGTGIGRGIALAFAREGAKVVISGRRPEPLQAVVGEIESSARLDSSARLAGSAVSVVADVSKNDDVIRLINTTVEKFGRIDILVNNAGVYIAHDIVSSTEEEWDQVMNIDFKGVVYCCKATLPYMLKQGKGKIVNIASIAGLVGFGGSAAYCAAKGAVVNLTRELAVDYAPKNINVNAIAPGVIETDMTKGILDDEATKNGLLANTSIGRFGKPADIANAAVYLASDESDFVVGHVLVVDGGWTIK